MKFFTIGYGGRKPEDFLDLLEKNKIKTIIDVRLRPDKASMGIYRKSYSDDKGIQGLLKKKNIKYFSFIELGNVFMNYEDWRKRYQQFLNNAGDILIERFQNMIQENQIEMTFCLLCAEKDFNKCHRHLIADYLVLKGHEVKHI
jgi:uncharacterized protein (DUF488 family)